MLPPRWRYLLLSLMRSLGKAERLPARIPAAPVNGRHYRLANIRWREHRGTYFGNSHAGTERRKSRLQREISRETCGVSASALAIDTGVWPVNVGAQLQAASFLCADFWGAAFRCDVIVRFESCVAGLASSSIKARAMRVGSCQKASPREAHTAPAAEAPASWGWRLCPPSQALFQALFALGAGFAEAPAHPVRLPLL